MNDISADSIEREIDRDRAEIETTLDAIGRRLRPGELLDQTIGYFRESGGELGTSVARSVKANPLPVILTGVSLAWLMSSTSSRAPLSDHETKGDYLRESNAREIERAREATASIKRSDGESENAFQERVTQAKAKVLALKRDAGETADSFRRRVDEYMSRAEAGLSEARQQAQSAWSSGVDVAGQRARQMTAQARRGQQGVADLYRAEPLLAGAIGIAAGALLAALFPATRAEEQALGETGDELREKARHEAGKLRDRTKESAREVVSAAADQATTETERAARAVEETVDEETAEQDQARDRAKD